MAEITITAKEVLEVLKEHFNAEEIMWDNDKGQDVIIIKSIEGLHDKSKIYRWVDPTVLPPNRWPDVTWTCSTVNTTGKTK